MNPRNLEICCEFIGRHFNVRSEDVPRRILRILRVRHGDRPDLSRPRFAPVRELMDRLLAPYGRRFGVTVEVLGPDDYCRLLRSEECASCAYRFTEYLCDGRRRIVYLQECDYLGMIVTFLDYVDAVLRSRRLFRRPVRNIRLFAFHAYPPRFTVLENRFRDGSPFVRIGDSYAMHYPGELVLFRTILGSHLPDLPSQNARSRGLRHA